MKHKEKFTHWWQDIQPWITKTKKLLKSCGGEMQMAVFRDICKKLSEAIVAERDIKIGNLNVHVKSIFSAQTTLDKAIQNIILRKSADKG
jgi:hypothetical protein